VLDESTVGYFVDKIETQRDFEALSHVPKSLSMN